MPSLDASTCFLAAGVALAVYVLLRPRRAAAPRPSRRPLGSGRLGKPSDVATAERPSELLHWQVEMHDTASQLKGELDCKLSALQALVILAQRESDRLEGAIRRAEQFDIPVRSGTLSILDQLGEPAQLEDPTALARAATSLHAALPAGVSEPFFGDETDLAVANLAATGLSPKEIAHRLRLPLGEVELRFSLVRR